MRPVVTTTAKFWEGFNVTTVVPKMVECFPVGKGSDGAKGFLLWAVTDDKRVIELRLSRERFGSLLESVISCFKGGAPSPEDADRVLQSLIKVLLPSEVASDGQEH